MTAIPKDEEKGLPQNELRADQLELLDDVPSVPYCLDFNIPVNKVMCGDLFAGLLTVEG